MNSVSDVIWQHGTAKKYKTMNKQLRREYVNKENLQGRRNKINRTPSNILALALPIMNARPTTKAPIEVSRSKGLIPNDAATTANTMK
jgi:hypothetical protein